MLSTKWLVILSFNDLFTYFHIHVTLQCFFSYSDIIKQAVQSNKLPFVHFMRQLSQKYRFFFFEDLKHSKILNKYLFIFLIGYDIDCFLGLTGSSISQLFQLVLLRRLIRSRKCLVH